MALYKYDRYRAEVESWTDDNVGYQQILIYPDDEVFGNWRFNSSTGYYEGIDPVRHGSGKRTQGVIITTHDNLGGTKVKFGRSMGRITDATNAYAKSGYIEYRNVRTHNAVPTGYVRGDFISSLTAEDGTYPNNGRHTDGYWYVKKDIANRPPTIDLSTTNSRTLYEGDAMGITGSIRDADAGNVMTVKYTINGGTTRAIHTAISTGASVPFSKILTFKNGRLFDGSNSVTSDLQEGAQHTLRVWAEDDQGGRSSDVLRTFQVVPNRPATLTIEPVQTGSGLIDSDKLTVRGNVSDPDGNTVKVEYRVAAESFQEVYNGAGGAFTFDVQLSRLKAGDNNVTVRATDSYGATTTKTFRFNKSGTVTPLLKSIVTYDIKPPNEQAQGVLIWISRDSGDIDVSAEISMTNAGEEENWVPMTRTATAFIDDDVEEDEWQYQADAAKTNIKLRLTLERSSTASTDGVRLISGVLS